LWQPHPQKVVASKKWYLQTGVEMSEEQDPLASAVALELASKFWSEAIAGGAITQEEAKALIPVCLITPPEMDVAEYMSSLVGPLDRVLKFAEGQPNV
jgi:hypothetical protein